MSQPFMGEIEYFGFTFPPKGWATCNGQLMSINQNQALFSLLGVTFGGDGRTTFALPNLQGQVAVGQGQGPGQPAYTMGETGGEEVHSLATNEMPPHTHSMNAMTTAGTSLEPAGNNLATGTGESTGGTKVGFNVYLAATPDTTMSANTIGPAGNAAHPNMMPYLTLTPCIALTGLYPSRS